MHVTPHDVSTTSTSRADRTPSRGNAAWIAATALAGFVASLIVLYPGQYPFDSAYQFWQARTGAYSNLSPVTMPLLWSLLLGLGAGPAALLVLNLAMMWSGLALCADALRGPAWARAAFLVVCGAAPLVLVQMAHVLTDAHLAAVLVLATGLLARTARRDTGVPWLAMGLLVYAAAIRHNAFLAVVPLAMLAASHAGVSWRTRGPAFAALVGAGFAFSATVDRFVVEERVTTWPTVALWDLAAVSVATNDLKLPSFTHGPGLTTEELRETRAFDPASNTHLFMRSRSGVGAGLSTPFHDDQYAELAAAWRGVVLDHTGDWFMHRQRTMLLMLGYRIHGYAGIAWFEERAAYRDNPAWPDAIAPTAQAKLYAFAEALRAHRLLDARLAPLLALAAVGVAMMQRLFSPVAHVGIAAAASSMLYTASFFVLAPGAEMRYLTWPIVIGLVALALVILARPRPQRPAAA